MNTLTVPPDITPIKVEKKKTTGTKELSTMARSLDVISKGMIDFMKTINRGKKKENEIAARLSALTDAIIENGDCNEPWIKEAIENLEDHIFHETFYTEKGGGNVIRMTDDTRMSHLRSFATEAAKVSSAKFRMSAEDYVPKVTVVNKAQRSIDIFRRVLKEAIGPHAGENVVKDTMEEICGVWDEQE